MKKNKKVVKKKKQFNIYSFMNKNKKTIVGAISLLLVFTLILGVFSQLAYSIR